MHRLELTTDEAQALHEALESFLSDLRVEVSHTENWQYKAALKKNEAHLRHVLTTLGVGASQPA